jgi:predicted Fe-Mo cluster-binding NifX family protein
MITRVAVASQNKKTITSHAGKCRHFYIYSIDREGNYTKELVDLSKEETLHYTFHEDPAANPHNYLYDMDILLTQSIGQGAIQKLALQNVTAYIIQETDPDTAIKKLIEGTLEAFAPVSSHKGHASCNCGGHHHHH